MSLTGSTAPAIVLLILLAAGAGAQPRAPGETPIADVLQIVVLPRQLLAIDAEGGLQREVDLELGESVHFTRTRGRVGIALTDRRVLAVSTRSGSWQDARYRLREPAPEGAWLGEQVAIVLTRTRAIGFDGGSGNLVTRDLGPGERVTHVEIAANVGIVVSDRRALGVSPFAGGFFEAKLQLRERIEGLEASGNFATLRTSRRILTFQAPSGVWSERRLDLH